jgi:hypothetical protein
MVDVYMVECYEEEAFHIKEGLYTLKQLERLVEECKRLKQGDNNGTNIKRRVTSNRSPSRRR